MKGPASTQGSDDARIALCPHISVTHFRGGEKWVVSLANRLAEDGVDVAVHALPYLPDGHRRVSVSDVLDERVPYRERWRHDLSEYDTAYVFYAPFLRGLFDGAGTTIAGIHSWVFVSDRLFERHYGPVPTAVKLLYRAIGPRDLRRFDAVHSVTPAFESPHPNTWYIPNFVDTDRFRPDRVPLADEFTVLVTSAHIPEKGWDRVRTVAARLPDAIRVVSTGESEDPNVEALGFLDEEELADAYARSHLVLHPARVDTDSMVINEACASGTPVVTTPLPTHVRNDRAVIHRDDPAGMVDAILAVFDEWERDDGYRERCDRALAAATDHSEETVYPQLKNLLRSSGAST